MPPVRPMSAPQQRGDDERLFRPPPMTRVLLHEGDRGGSPPQTPPRVPIGDLSPAQPFVPVKPPPRFHLGTPERASSAPPKSALRDQSRGRAKKVRILDAGDGFEHMEDRVPAFLFSDDATESPPLRGSEAVAGRPKN